MWSWCCQQKGIVFIVAIRYQACHFLPMYWVKIGRCAVWAVSLLRKVSSRRGLSNTILTAVKLIVPPVSLIRYISCKRMTTMISNRNLFTISKGTALLSCQSAICAVLPVVGWLKPSCIALMAWTLAKSISPINGCAWYGMTKNCRLAKFWQMCKPLGMMPNPIGKIPMRRCSSEIIAVCCFNWALRHWVPCKRWCLQWRYILGNIQVSASTIGNFYAGYRCLLVFLCFWLQGCHFFNRRGQPSKPAKSIWMCRLVSPLSLPFWQVYMRHWPTRARPIMTRLVCWYFSYWRANLSSTMPG